MEVYKIKKEGENKYTFKTKKNIEYQLVIKKSGMAYQDLEGNKINVLQVDLNCDTNTADKDYTTLKTLVNFCTQMSRRYDSLFMQIHNQPEIVNRQKTERRGLSRIKLWSRTLATYSPEHILITNLALSPNKNSDILSIIVKKDSIYFKQLVANFYRFSHARMHKINS